MAGTKRKYLLAAIIAILGLETNTAKTKSLNGEEIANPGGEWLSYGRDYTEQRFSPLSKINHNNVKNLTLEWSFTFATARGMESTPLVHDGVIYVSTGWSHVYALDAMTGKQIWHYDAKVSKTILAKTCCGPVNRGVGLWQGSVTEPLQVFLAALDGRLIALDAKTGMENWSTQTTPTNGNYSITGAPRIAKGLVFIGNSGGELGVRGFISAYDVLTGEKRWRVYTVPRDPKKLQESPALSKALETWNGDYWHTQGGGGGTIWDSIVYDPKFDLLFVGTGNGSPWNRNIRSPGGGDNLYLSSILALDPENGKYVWHYQVTPKDNWDYTATQQLVLAQLEIDGSTRDVIMQAPKNGFFYVLDRVSGELLSANPYTHITWASHVDMKTGRPVETKYANYQKNGGSYIWPSPFGAHNWQPMSFNPNTGLVYIPVQNIPGYFSEIDKVEYKINRWNTGVDLNEARDARSWVTAKASRDALVYGELVAWDPVKGSSKWRVRLPKPSNGGVLSTAGGIVFQGTHEGKFAAYDADDGEHLWEYKSDSAILAGPISYEINNNQYIAVTQGGGGTVMLTLGEDLKYQRVNHNKLLVFRLGKSNQSPKQSTESLAAILPLEDELSVDKKIIRHGEMLYGRNCASCHGISAKGNGVLPDLRYMDKETHSGFMAIVLGGTKSEHGMLGYHDTLTALDVENIHHFLKKKQHELPDRLEMSNLQKLEYWGIFWLSKLGEKFPFILNWTRGLIM